MSKEKRIASKAREELRREIQRLEKRLRETPPNTLAREKYTADLLNARQRLQRLN